MKDSNQVLFVGGPLAGSVRAIREHVTTVSCQQPKPKPGIAAYWADEESVEVETHEYDVTTVGKIRIAFHRGTLRDDLLAEVFTAYLDKLARENDEAKRYRVDTVAEAERRFARQYEILNPVDANHICFMDAFRLGFMFGRNGFASIETMSSLDWREKAFS